MDVARADIVIVGGGVAGLWTRAVLVRAGYSVILVESRALGSGQTVASQGILHRGVKYALSAEARDASHALASAQDEWRRCLGLADGPAPIDLRGVEVLSERMHLWATGLLEKATGVGAALAMRSEVRRLPRAQYPPAFREAPSAVAVWEVDELSVSAASLTGRLADAADGPILHTAVEGVTFGPADQHRQRVLIRNDEGSACEITASAVILAAGEGNERLLQSAGAQPRMQRRPLHMVLVDGAPGPLFAHLPRPGSDKPRLTITSSRTNRGWCWYIGGDLAETGVARTREEQVAFAQRELAETLPWMDLHAGRWTAFRIDRAEGETESGRRPDGPVARRSGRIIAVWPTKLALAPIAARLVTEEVARIGQPGPAPDIGSLARWPRPGVARAPWDWPELVWSEA